MRGLIMQVGALTQSCMRSRAPFIIHAECPSDLLQRASEGNLCQEFGMFIYSGDLDERGSHVVEGIVLHNRNILWRTRCCRRLFPQHARMRRKTVACSEQARTREKDTGNSVRYKNSTAVRSKSCQFTLLR